MNEEYKPALAMVAMQFNYAAMALLAKAAFAKGMSPMVFVVYRQAIASLVLAPISFFARSSRGQLGMGVRAFGLVFLVSLVGDGIGFFFDGHSNEQSHPINHLCDGCLSWGIFGSAVTYYLQSWCISVRGPLFSALFNPLCTVITTIAACIVLHEQFHLGSLIGAVAVVSGLYLVLWGKAKDYESKSKLLQSGVSDKITVAVEDDLRKPLIDALEK